MELVPAVIIGIYGIIFVVLSIFGVHRYSLIFRYYHNRKQTPPSGTLDPLPKVTVQLPIYNEAYVVDRLIEAVCNLEYPRDRLQVQVLDDSTDETQRIAKAGVEKFTRQGVDIAYIHRPDREGFKAGALAHGLGSAKGEFVAIFDADFIPQPGFLMDTIHYFCDEKVGMVQARWDHVNRGYSLLTRVQAILLDGHFVLEHGARYFSNLFFNFNGTAGIWRKTSIEDSGGWMHDTLTEDMDLSYRAQLRGWRFIYVPEVAVPSELPVEMNAFKSQQDRWVKGSIQNARKLLIQVLKSPLPLKVKVEAVFHLTNNVAHICIALLAFLIFPAIVVRLHMNWPKSWIVLTDLLVFAAATGSVFCFYLYSQKEVRQKLISTIALIPLVMMVGIGISLNNSKALLEGLFNTKSPFERTPKFNVQHKLDEWKSKRYRGKQNWLSYIELGLGVFFTGAIALAFYWDLYGSIPFLMLFQCGFLYTGLLSLAQRHPRIAIFRKRALP